MFARFILWDMSGAVKRENRSVETLGVQRTKSFAWVLGCASGVGFLRYAMPGHFTVAFRVGAGEVLGGARTLASPWAEGCLVCMQCGVRVRRATQASLRGRKPLPKPTHEKPTLGHNPLISISTPCRSSLRRTLNRQSSCSHKPYPLNPLPMRLTRSSVSRERIKRMPIIFNLLPIRIRHNTQCTWKSSRARR